MKAGKIKIDREETKDICDTIKAILTPQFIEKITECVSSLEKLIKTINK